MDHEKHLTDRELSWLAFNQRVLELAEDVTIPLLERVRFMAIFASNLDEFFMVRVATLQTKIESGHQSPNAAGYTPRKLMDEVLTTSQQFMERLYDLYRNSILPALGENGIEVLTWEKLTQSEIDYVNELFDSRIFPVLTPLAVDPSHPFPYISGLSLNLAVIVKNAQTDEEFFARVKVPPILPRLIATAKEGSMRFIPLESVIETHLGQLFPGMEIRDHFSFRVTRNQDFELEEEDSDDLLLSLEQELLRRRFGPPVRLEVEKGIKPELLSKLVSELGIDSGSIFTCDTPLDLTDLNRIADLDLPGLKYPKFRAQTVPELVGAHADDVGSYFARIRAGDILLHHPYDSFTTSVVDFLASASRDPAVLAIKQTLYRTSGDSPIVEALIEAAEAGKQVLAVVEIRARFDEQANVHWARKLEAAGVHVVYGLMGLKTHAKLSLVVRDEEDGLRRYCHIGTGNYNPKTARLYEDIGILTCDAEVTDDLTRLFNQLSGFAPQSTYSKLLVAPRTLRTGLLEKIDNEIKNAEAGLPSGIQFKLNSLLDEEFVEALYKAAKHGVKVDLLVRGICALQTGHGAHAGNIKVRSILGRFLEHSRILHFVNAGQDEYWIGSADLMHRNLDRRVESMVRIDGADHQQSLQHILDLGLSDDTSSWHLQGTEWVRVSKAADGSPLIDLQNELIHETRTFAEGR